MAPHTHTHCAAVADSCRSVINVLIAPSGGLKLVSITVKLMHMRCVYQINAEDYKIILL